MHQRNPFDINFISDVLRNSILRIRTCRKYFTKPAKISENSPNSDVVITNSPTIDMEILDDPLDDIFNDLHSNQGVNDICSSADAPLVCSSSLQEDGNTDINKTMSTYNVSAYTLM